MPAIQVAQAPRPSAVIQRPRLAGSTAPMRLKAVANTSSVSRKAILSRSRRDSGRKRASKGPYSRWRALSSEHSATTHSQGVPALIEASSRNWLAPA